MLKLIVHLQPSFSICEPTVQRIQSVIGFQTFSNQGQIEINAFNNLENVQYS
jgi:hypothetical protein